MIGMHLVELLDEVGAAGHRGNLIEFLIFAAGNHLLVVVDGRCQPFLDPLNGRHGFLVASEILFHGRQVLIGFVEVAAQLRFDVLYNRRFGLLRLCRVGLELLGVVTGRLNMPPRRTQRPIGRPADLVSVRASGQRLGIRYGLKACNCQDGQRRRAKKASFGDAHGIPLLKDVFDVAAVGGNPKAKRVPMPRPPGHIAVISFAAMCYTALEHK